VIEGRQRRLTIAGRLTAFVLPILFLAPFSAKPYQADDHLTIWVAEQIAQHPFDFFGFDIDYGYARVPIHTISHNPPATAYFLAALGTLSEWNLVVLHLGMCLFAGLAALGMYELARDFGAHPLFACAAAVLTPAFLVSASTLMTDMPMLACYVWAVAAWRRGCEQSSWQWLSVAAVCASLAPFMKFFGITLVPLFLLDATLRRPQIRLWWVTLLAPIAAFGALQAYTYFR
jgi:4-amino-4-deoxy-L-arabinose transferase-like glycosyltransferase